MPEGNTIHRLALDHTRDLAGRIVRVSSPQGRFAREARRLDGKRFVSAEAHGKHLFHLWRGGLVVHVHLGLAGEFRRAAGPKVEPRPTVRMRLAVPGVAIDLIGPPTCELITERERSAVVARLGPDPLRDDADPEAARAALSKRPDRPIGDALLDQRVLAGVGNIYRNEALFLCGIHPLRRAGSVGDSEWAALWSTIRDLLCRGVREGTVTVDPAEAPHPSASRPTAGEGDFYVYGARRCRRCGGPVRVFPLSGRRMYACPSCQPRRPKSKGRA